MTPDAPAEPGVPVDDYLARIAAAKASQDAVAARENGQVAALEAWVREREEDRAAWRRWLWTVLDALADTAKRTGLEVALPAARAALAGWAEREARRWAERRS